MTIRTSQEDGIGFAISLDDRLIYKVSDLPKRFALQLLGSNSYWITRENQDFLSNRRYTLSNYEGSELAIIKINALLCYTGFLIGPRSYDIKSNSPKIGEILKGQNSVEVEELGVKCAVVERLLSIQLTTEINDMDDVSIATIVLLHFARINIWRES